MKHILCILLIFCFGFTFSQNPYTIKYSIEEGLPTSNIYSVFEASDGYIWFATDVGVLKYDGYSFQHFNTDNGLADNEVFQIYEDKQNRLWFLTLNGKLSFYKDKQFFNNKILENLNKASYKSMIMDISEDVKGNLYFLFADGHVSIIDKHLKVVQIKDYNSTSYSIWQSKNTTNILSRTAVIDLNSDKQFDMPEGIITNSVYRYYKNKTQGYYFATNNAICKYKENSFTPVFSIKEKEIIHLNIIDDVFWIGTKSGLILKDKEREIVYFKNDIVSNVLKDSQGNYWVTTLNDGIKFIPHLELKKLDILDENTKVNTLQFDNNNNLWIGTSNNGLIQTKYKNGSIALVKQPNIKRNIKKVRSFNDNIFVISSESLQVITKNKTKTYPIGGIDILNRGNDFILTSNHVYRFKLKELLALKNYGNENDYKVFKDNVIFRRRTNVVVEGIDNHVFFGTSTGLYDYYNNEIKKVASLNEELSTTILDLYFDNTSKKLIVATSSKGLIVLENNTIVNHITTLQKLNSNSCNSIKKINKNTYLIGTNKGLNYVKLNKENTEVKNYNNLLKVNNEKVNDIEYVNENVYLATDKGLLSFNINKVEKSLFTPKLSINNILVNGEPVDKLEALKFNQNNITVSFTGISFSDYGSLLYEYKLNNEQDWTKTNNRQIEFKNLPHDNYKLQVRTVGNNNIYSATKIVSFKIKSPFWKTAPFFLVLVTILSSVIYLFVKGRLKQQNRQFELERITFQTKQEKIELEKETAQLEQKALRLQMNPHFIFNALNTIKGYYSGGNITEANKYISKFSKLLRLILENDEQFISLEKEIEMLELYIKLIQLRYENNFDYNIKLSEAIISDEIGIPPLLLQPIVENAIIHGISPNTIKGKLNIIFTVSEKQLICTVTDNGIGITASRLNNKSGHKSKAINITKERVQFINNTKDSRNFQIIELNEPTGTQVIIKLPIIKLW